MDYHQLSSRELFWRLWISCCFCRYNFGADWDVCDGYIYICVNTSGVRRGSRSWASDHRYGSSVRLSGCWLLSHISDDRYLLSPSHFNRACWWVSHNALFGNPRHTHSFWLSISGNSSEKLHFWKFANMPYSQLNAKWLIFPWNPEIWTLFLATLENKTDKDRKKLELRVCSQQFEALVLKFSITVIDDILQHKNPNNYASYCRYIMQRS